ncbi:MAG TPA: serine hydrolase domain-containing protein [Flavobacterium sp.]|nr:serine hydrolase domain-containing protein [Flavobacterium sp.]
MACVFPCSLKLPKLSVSYVNEKQAMVERFANKLWNKNDNVSFLVARNGQIIYEKYAGYADNKKNFITAHTPMHIASVSKMLTAAAIMQLVNRDKLDLDQKVNTILKTFPYPDITIRMLLNHRSGLRNYAYFTADPGVWDTKQTITNEDILRLLGEKNIALATPAGTHFAYCNTNYAMLALVIERITGLKYGEAMQRMIFKPLGMTDTYVFDLEKDKETASQTFKGNGLHLAYDFLDAVYGDKNIYSTPRDLMKFDMATYDPNFLDKDLFKQVYKGYSYESKGTKNYGLGIRMIEWETGQHFYFHNGWWHGNTSSYVTLRNEKVTIIALSNKMTKKTYLVRKLAPGFGDYPFKKDKDEEKLE